MSSAAFAMMRLMRSSVGAGSDATLSSAKVIGVCRAFAIFSASAWIASNTSLIFSACEIANLQTHDDPARDHVGRAGFCANPADGGDLSAGHAGGDAVDGEHELRGAQQRVTTAIHRRGAGMIGDAVDRDVPPANADDAFDDADIDVAFIENCALLDVQLDERLRARPACAGLAPGDRDHRLRRGCLHESSCRYGS